MATMALSRRANSLPANTVDLLEGSQPDLDSLQRQNEGRLATSPSFFEPRSPTAIATFSPVFELELGGTPQEQQQDRPQHLRRGAFAPVPFRQLLPAQPLAALRQLPHVTRAVTGAAAGAALDRSQSDLQVMLAQHQGAKAVVQHAVEVLTPAAERLLELSKPDNELELELSRRLRAFRNARIAKPHSSTSSTPAPDSGPSSGGAGCHSAAALAAPQNGAASPSGPTPGEIEALAFELQSAGFIVQILDGTRLSKDTRSCLRTLKHRFLVCTGWAGPSQRRAQQPHPLQFPQQQPQQPQQQRLTEPLVVEVRFREQFLIANPSRAYEHLLLALPVVFVGPMRRLDAVVELMAAQVAAVFKQAGRPLPPWRTKGAMLSKWAPSQLIDLERVMRQAAAPQTQTQQQQEEMLKELQRQDLEHGSDCHTSWGSGIGEPSPRVEFVVTNPFQPAATDAGGVERDHPKPSGAASAAAAAAATITGLDTPSGVPLAPDANPRDGATATQLCSSTPPRSLRTPPPAAGAAGAADGTASPFYTYNNGPDQLLYDGRSSISSLGPPDASELGVGPSALPGQDVAAAAIAAAPAATATMATAGEPFRGGLTFPVLPEVSVRAPGAPQRLLGPFAALRHGPPPPLPSSPEEEEPATRQLAQQPQQHREEEQDPREDLGRVPSLPPPPRSAFSPFACVSMPNVLDPDEEGFGAPYSEENVTPPKVHSDTMPRAPAAAVAGSLIGVGSGSLPEFTLRHAALAVAPLPPQMTIAAAAAGALWPGPTLPMPTPPRTAAPLYDSAFHAGLPQAAAAAGVPVGPADMGLILAHQPLASAALGLNAAMAAGVVPGAPSTPAPPPGAAAAVTTASTLTTVQTHPGGITGGGSGAGGGGFMLPFAKGDSFRITRRSSSDLSRAASKFKNAKSLLAAALRRATGAGPGKDGSGAAAPPSPGAAPGGVGGVSTGPSGASAQGYAPLGWPQQELRDGLVRDNRDRSGAGGGGAGGWQQPPGAVGTAAAGAPEVLGAGAAPRAGAGAHGHGYGHSHDVTQVALAGGVMTRPSADEPPWARIATVRWGPPAAGAGGAPPAGAAAAAAAAAAGRAL